MPALRRRCWRLGNMTLLTSVSLSAMRGYDTLSVADHHCPTPEILLTLRWYFYNFWMQFYTALHLRWCRHVAALDPVGQPLYDSVFDLSCRLCLTVIFEGVSAEQAKTLARAGRVELVCHAEAAHQRTVGRCGLSCLFGLSGRQDTSMLLHTNYKFAKLFSSVATFW